MRALILAAGLGTRLRPLTHLRAKPALPVRGIPILATLLRLLDENEIREVMINTHHLPESIHDVVERYCPSRMQVQFSHESTLLNTGGAIRRVVDFLRDSDPCLVLAGDMLLDCDLRAFLAAHRAEENAITLLLRDDPRMARFGSIGIDTQKCVRRIGKRFDLGGESSRGLYLSVTAIASRALATLPAREVFNHLDDWICPQLQAGARDIRAQLFPADACAAGRTLTPRAGEHTLAPQPTSSAAPFAIHPHATSPVRATQEAHLAHPLLKTTAPEKGTQPQPSPLSVATSPAVSPSTPLVWEPVGTLTEYFDANFFLPPAYNAKLDTWAKQDGATLGTNFVIGPTAQIGTDVHLEQVVVWDGERVPSGQRLRRGVFAGGQFHACPVEANSTT